MINKDCIEAAYCFFHQKLRVYVHSHNDTQKDDIENIIGDYVNGMNRELYKQIAEDNNSFLHEHTSFANDLSDAVERLEKMI